MAINKYNLDWQIVRLRAKQCTTVQAKIFIVHAFLVCHATAENVARVKNWAEMVKLGYGKSTADRTVMEAFIKELELYKRRTFPNPAERNYNFSDYEHKELEALLKDLKRRKWDFQFNKAPAAHYEFVSKLEEAVHGKKEEKVRVQNS